MITMKNQDCTANQVTECEEKFPTWKQLLTTVLSTVIGGVAIIGGCIFVYAKNQTATEYELKDHASLIADNTSRIMKLEKVSQDLDTIKQILRNK